MTDITGRKPLEFSAQTIADLKTVLSILTQVVADGRYLQTSDATTALALKAALASPTFTGTPAAPTAPWGTATTQLATTEFIASGSGRTTAKVMADLGYNVKGLPFRWGFNTLGTTGVMVDGTLYMTLLEPIYEALTITGIEAVIGTSGQAVFTADNFNGFALFKVMMDGTYSRVAISADVANTLKTTTSTVITVPFTSPYSLTPGYYVAAALYNSSAQTTAPALMQISSSGNTSFANIFTATNAKVFSTLAAQTAIPSTITVSGTTNAGNGMFMKLY